MWLVLEWQYHSGLGLAFDEDIVLDDKVVPVSKPNVLIRTHFGMHWAKPLIRAGQKVPSVFFHKTGSLRFNDGVVGKTYGRFADKSDTVPVFLWVIPSRVKLNT